MKREEIINLAEDSRITIRVDGNYSGSAEDLERFSSAIEAHLISEGYRQCAKGQRTTQWCGQVDEKNKIIAAQQARIAELVKGISHECIKRNLDENHRLRLLLPFHPDDLRALNEAKAQAIESLLHEWIKEQAQELREKKLQSLLLFLCGR